MFVNLFRVKRKIENRWLLYRVNRAWRDGLDADDKEFLQKLRATYRRLLE